MARSLIISLIYKTSLELFGMITFITGLVGLVQNNLNSNLFFSDKADTDPFYLENLLFPSTGLWDTDMFLQGEVFFICIASKEHKEFIIIINYYNI